MSDSQAGISLRPIYCHFVNNENICLIPTVGEYSRLTMRIETRVLEFQPFVGVACVPFVPINV